MIGSDNMDEKVFFDRLKKEDYENLEKELIQDYRANRNLQSRYFLGICYSEQFEKREDAIRVFKELINTELSHPYMFVYLARWANGSLEKIKIINEGLNKFPTNKKLNIQLLYYLDNKKKEEQYQKLIELKIETFDCSIEMISYYFEKKKYSLALKILNSINKSEETKDTEFLKIVALYFSNGKIEKKKLDSFIVSDNNSLQGLIVKLVEILCEKEEHTITEMISRLPYSTEYEEPFLEMVNISDFNNSYFELDCLIFSLISEINEKELKRDLKRKLELISVILEFNWNEDIKSGKLKSAEKLIEDELKNNNDKLLFLKLMEILLRQRKYKKYFDTYIWALENLFFKIEDLDLNEFPDDEMNCIVEKVNKININDYNRNVYQKLIEDVIITLHGKSMHESIVKIADKMNYKRFDYLNFGFELAYSFSEMDRKKEAQLIYEEYLKKDPKNSAVLNNLGVIYENLRQYEKALKFYEKAEKISHSNRTVNNIKRCKSNIEELKIEKKLEEESLSAFNDESFWMISKLEHFYSHSDDDGNIVCSYKQLPNFLKCSPEKAQETINYMIEKKYVFRNKKHNYDTSSSVYKRNLLVSKKIIEMKKANDIITTFVSKTEGFTLKEFEEIQYLEVLNKIKTIRDRKIKNIFIRDYNELVFSYLSKQSKSVVLLSGTLMELLLLYVLGHNKIKTYKVGSKQDNKKIEEMNISEMLDVCEKEKILHSTPEKFIDGMKQFRNFIHPGKELREKVLEIDKTTVDLAIIIINWLILSIEFK